MEQARGGGVLTILGGVKERTVCGRAARHGRGVAEGRWAAWSGQQSSPGANPAAAAGGAEREGLTPGRAGRGGHSRALPAALRREPQGSADGEAAGPQPWRALWMPARSRPPPGQPAAASGLSSWEQQRYSSSSDPSSVQCTLNPPSHRGLVRPGTWLGATGWGEKRAGFQRAGVCAEGARGDSVLSRPIPPSVPPSFTPGAITDPLWDTQLLRRRRVFVSLPCFSI